MSALGISRLSSAVVTVGYLAAVLSTGAGLATLAMALYMVVPLLCIRLPDVRGDAAFSHALPLNHSPGWLTVFGGWVLLLLPVGFPFLKSSKKLVSSLYV